MEYFSGSLLNPKVPNGKDNRNKTPFDQYFPNMAQPSSRMPPMLQPRNEALQLPPILNPSAAYRAFAEPSPNESIFEFIRNRRPKSYRSPFKERKFLTQPPERTPDPQPRYGVPYIGDTPLFNYRNPPNRNPSRDLRFNPSGRRPLFRPSLYPQITDRPSINPILRSPIPPMFMR